MKLSLNTYLMCAIAVCFSLNSLLIEAQTVGQQAPTLILPNQNGQDSDLADLRGNYVYLHFWASWCPNSIEQLPTITQIYDEYKDHNFKIYSVSLDANRDAWLNAIDAYRLIWPQHQCDFSGPFSQRIKGYNFIGTPFGYLISPSGEILEVDPDIYSYDAWFKSGAMTGDYYTIHLGTFSDLKHVDFEYIEELAIPESGLTEDGSMYYVNLGKYSSRNEAEVTLLEALNRGYYEAMIVTDNYNNGDIGLNYVQPRTRQIEENQPSYYTAPSPQPSSTNPFYNHNSNPTPNPNPNPNPNLTPNFNPADYYSVPYQNKRSTPIPDNSSIGINTPNASTDNTSNSATSKSIYEESFFTNKKSTPKTSPPSTPTPFYTKPKEKSKPIFEEEGITYNELPNLQEYPNKKEDDQEANSEFSKTQEGKDFFNGPNPYMKYGDTSKIKPTEYDFKSKWQNTEGGLKPLSPPESPMDNVTESNEESFYAPQPSDENNLNSYSEYGDYSTIHPSENIYLEEALPETNYKESKYERKLRVKKKKVARKQEKLKKQLEQMKKEMEEINSSIEVTKQYPDF